MLREFLHVVGSVLHPYMIFNINLEKFQVLSSTLRKAYEPG